MINSTITFVVPNTIFVLHYVLSDFHSFLQTGNTLIRKLPTQFLLFIGPHALLYYPLPLLQDNMFGSRYLINR